MSKVIKQMQMDALKNEFSGVKNLVFLSQSRLGAIAENQLRLALRKKSMRLHQVKNSLARKVFAESGPGSSPSGQRQYRSCLGR